MVERYIKQFEFVSDVCLNDCIVALEKGAVLFDNKTNTYKLQLKFANTGTIAITSVHIYVEALDNTGDLAYPDLSFTYDEFAQTGDTFGTKKLISVQNGNAIKFRVYVERVTTVDGQTHSYLREQYVSIAVIECNNLAKEQQEAEEERNRQELEASGCTGTIIESISLINACSSVMP